MPCVSLAQSNCRTQKHVNALLHPFTYGTSKAIRVEEAM
jgi:hypothetical protein